MYRILALIVALSWSMLAWGQESGPQANEPSKAANAPSEATAQPNEPSIAEIILSVAEAKLQIRRMESKMKDSSVYAPVAKRLATYCQSDPALFPEDLSYAWLPSELADIGFGRAWVSTDAAQVEMGGGFHHFGYKLNLEQSKSTDDTNAWQLSFYSEDSNDTVLAEITLPRAQRVTKDKLLATVASGFDRRLTSHPKDDVAFKGKVLLFLRFENLPEARKACEEWSKARPDYWLPHSTLAHVRSRLGEGQEAQAQFAKWVAEHKNFPHYIYLFLFDMREARTEAALGAIREAVDQPFVEPANTEGNKFYLGYNAAVFAFIQHDYDLSLSLCDKMLADSREDEWWRPKIRRVRAAVLFMKGNGAQAIEFLNKTRSYAEHQQLASVYEDRQKKDSLFLAAIEKNDHDFVSTFENWKDELDSWFSPYETDETGIHGEANMITPYPKEWDEKKMIPIKPRTVQ